MIIVATVLIELSTGKRIKAGFTENLSADNMIKTITKSIKSSTPFKILRQYVNPAHVVRYKKGNKF